MMMVGFILAEIAGALVCEVGSTLIRKNVARSKPVSPVELVSDSPGRLRLRVPAIKNDPRCAQRIERELSLQKWVSEVKANPITSTVLVIYNDTKATPRMLERCAHLALTAALKDIYEPDASNTAHPSASRLPRPTTQPIPVFLD
jgi:hypothetical protein